MFTGQKIGKYIKYQRNKRGWSLQNLARKSLLTPSFLARLETGSYGNISYGAIEQLARGFAIPLLIFLKKCDLAEDRYISLPDYEFYLREKFQLPNKAVEDMKLFLALILKKYKKEITRLKTKHKQYWKSQT